MSAQEDVIVPLLNNDKATYEALGEEGHRCNQQKKQGVVLVLEVPEEGDGIQLEISGDSKTVVDQGKATVGVGSSWRDLKTVARVVAQGGQFEEVGERLDSAHLPRTRQGSWCLGGQRGEGKNK